MVRVQGNLSCGVDYAVGWAVSEREAKCEIPYHYEVFCKRRNGSPEMTLIATASSPEGFAIAADGRQVHVDPTDQKERINDVQKLFSTPFANDTGFAWAWVGHVEVESISACCYDLKNITQRVVDELPKDAYSDDPESYFQRIADRIFYELPTDVNFPHTTDDEVIFVGYLAGKPLRVEIVFRHKGTAFLPPFVTELRIAPRNFYAFSGSLTISEQMHNARTLLPPFYLEDAVIAVSKYAKTCVESQTSVPDCRKFGGTVHVATVTKGGFEWITEPKNLKK